MSDIQRIKDTLDIGNFIGEYVRLKPAGVNQKGLCPFHHEKSPSFMVSRERQRWHCFGCSKGGDIFSFVQEIEGMEFVEALKFLAQKAGVPLTTERSQTNTSQKNRLKDINEVAARFFHQFLLQMAGAASARDYLAQRGVRQDTIEAWQVGYVPEQWDLLTQYLLKKNFSIDDLVASGLTIKRDGADATSGRGFYDRFRGRVMFPIRDVHGMVVGFTGRVLVETEHSGGKYVNTPQTLLYDKSRVVFGLDKAKQTIRAKDSIVMVEGQMDVVACHQAGMTNVVATSGTAMTSEQITLLKRYSSNLSIAFDADVAGQNAAKRGIDVALEAGMSVKVISLPEDAGKDADECLKKNPQVWFEAVAGAKDIMAWYVEKSFRGRDISSAKDKQQIANELLPEIARIPFAVERDHWLREVGNRLQVEVSVLREDLERLTRQKKTGGEDKKSVVKTPAPEPQSRLTVVGERLLTLMLCFPGTVLMIQKQLDLAHLSTPGLKALYEAVFIQYTSTQSLQIAELRNSLSDDSLRTYLDILVMKGDLLFGDVGEGDAKREAEILIHEIRTEGDKKRRSELQAAIAAAERAGNTALVEELMQQFLKM